MSALDQDGQPIAPFSRKANRAKAANSLIGFLQGITADDRLNDKELLALNVWLLDSESLHNDPDVVDLLDLARDILSDGEITADERLDMLSLAQSIIDSRPLSPDATLKDRMNQLLGIAHGLVCDQAINDDELQFLRNWVIRNNDLAAQFPGSVIHRTALDITNKGIVSSADRQHLIDTLADMVGGSLQENGGYGFSTRLPLDDVRELTIARNTFCLTGKFIFGPRRKCENAIDERGGFTFDTVTFHVGYLVIGTLSSRDWAHGSCGRKIQHAVERRDKGHPIKIISEEAWVRAL